MERSCPIPWRPRGVHQWIHIQRGGRADRQIRCARCPVLPGHPGHAATTTEGWTDNVCCVIGDSPTTGESPADDHATPPPIGYPRPATLHRPIGQSRVLRTGRWARPCDRCLRSAPGVRPPRAFPLRNRRRSSRRPLARVARPACHRLRHHGRGTGCHRGRSHAFSCRHVLVLAATGRPRAAPAPFGCGTHRGGRRGASPPPPPIRGAFGRRGWAASRTRSPSTPGPRPPAPAARSGTPGRYALR